MCRRLWGSHITGLSLHEPCAPHCPPQSGKGSRDKACYDRVPQCLRHILRTKPWGVNANQGAVRGTWWDNAGAVSFLPTLKTALLSREDGDPHAQAQPVVFAYIAVF